MKDRTVLATIDLNAEAFGPAVCGIQLALRMKSTLTLMAIIPPSKEGGSDRCGDISLDALNSYQHRWLSHMVEQSQRHGLIIEIYLSSGLFLEEVTRFVRSRPAVQCIVMGIPRDFPHEERAGFFSALENLHAAFQGEILLVQERTNPMHVSSRDVHEPGKER